MLLCRELPSYELSSSPYFVGWTDRNASPKQAEKVGCGSVTPRSVPASLAVNPDRKWYLVCSFVRFWYGRKNTKSIGTKKNYFIGMTTFWNRFYNILNVVYWIWNPGVLSYRAIIEIYLAIFVNGNVFKQSITFNGIVNVGFSIFIEVDNFGIASAFEIKNTIIVPSVFVITDKQAFGVGRECVLPVPDKPKENSNIPVFAHVCRAVP